MYLIEMLLLKVICSVVIGLIFNIINQIGTLIPMEEILLHELVELFYKFFSILFEEKWLEVSKSIYLVYLQRI